MRKQKVFRKITITVSGAHDRALNEALEEAISMAREAVERGGDFTHDATNGEGVFNLAITDDVQQMK